MRALANRRKLNVAITSSGSSLVLSNSPRRTATSAVRAGRKDPIGAVPTSGSSNTPVAVASSPEPDGLSTAAAGKRAWAFCGAVERHYFPLYEQDELQALIYSIPFVALGWSYDDFHDLDRRHGTLMLRAICAEPYATNVGARVPLLDAVEGLGIVHDVLLRIPGDGIPPRGSPRC
jgi:hypothetical protein